MITQYQLGQHIYVDHMLKRHRFRGERTWQKSNFGFKTDVMIVGIRTLADGHAESGDDEPTWFVGSKYFKALLVVETIHSKPFYTLIE